MYQLGLGCNKDYKKAFYYYNLSLEVPINKAHIWAQYNLAKYFYLSGNYETNTEKDEYKAINLLNNSSEKGLLKATIELLYYYTDKYFENKTTKTLTTINNLITKIENHPNFNATYKKEIEQTISKIKNKPTINKELFNL